MILPAGALAEHASQPTSAASGGLDVGGRHTCALVAGGKVRCWGSSVNGQLGYGNTNTIGDDETPGSVGPVDLGAGRTVKTMSAGDFHTCAVLGDAGVPGDSNVRCWGFGGDGRLGYGNTKSIGVNPGETPASAGPVDLGAGRTALDISAGGVHTCAVRDDGKVLCWGYGFTGELGYKFGKSDPPTLVIQNTNVGDDETPANPPHGVPAGLDLGPGRATAISVGSRHACALIDVTPLDTGKVRCWGVGGSGELGYGNGENIGDDETPGEVAPVDVGGRAVAISAGGFHTCALLEDGTVRCWGFGANGQLGYGNTNSIGITEAPSAAGAVSLGGRAVAISAGGSESCAVLEDGSARCWGNGISGQLGYGNTNVIGDNETPASVGSISLGEGRRATAISAGGRHTCARLDDGNVRCWGYALNGRLGYCNLNNIGDDEKPDSAGPVALETPGPPCPVLSGAGAAPPPGGAGGGEAVPGTSGAPSGGAVDPLAVQAQRARDLRACMADAARMARRRRAGARRACLKRYGRTPGGVEGLRARAVSKTKVVLSFTATGTDGSSPPAARGYLVKQATRAIGSARVFGRARSLCRGNCRFGITRVGDKVHLTIINLRPSSTYYYAIAARDNVSKRLGPRSRAIKVSTR